MDIVNVDIKKLNENILTNTYKYIDDCENFYKVQIENIVNHIKQNDKIKFILLAGPSSSGKTTSAKLLKQALEKHRFNAKTISLDDFFVERDETPLWPDGTPNYESVDSIDWKLFDKCIHELLENGKTLMPTYNFIEGIKFYQDTLTLKESDIIIIEGLHSLNTIIDNFISKDLCAKIYIEPKVNYMLDDKIIIDGVNLRFFRRLIRDLYTRGSSVDKTMEDWKSVRMGEKLYIDPFKDIADFFINSSHPYEICIYKSIIEFLELEKNKKLEKLLKPFKEIEKLEKSEMPINSLLQEFVH